MRCERRPKTGTEPEEEHLSTLVTAERLHGRVVDQTTAGTPTDTASYDQSSVSPFTRSTIGRGASSGPDGKRRGSLAPNETSSLTYEPPTSTARTFMEERALMSLFWG